MPELPIKDINSMHTVLITQAIMFCWPDKDLIESMTAVIIAHGLRESQLPIPQPMAYKLIDSPAFSEVMRKVPKGKAHSRGAIAGDILIYLFIQHYYGEEPSLYKARAEVRSSYDGAKVINKKRGVGWGERQVKKAWRDHKAVAPLWASFRIIHQFHSKWTYSPDQMKQLFSVSEFLADFGATLMLNNKANKTNEPPLSEGEAWRVPVEVKKQLPDIELIPPKGKNSAWIIKPKGVNPDMYIKLRNEIQKKRMDFLTSRLYPHK